jgi:hypothetical protein
MTPEKGEFQRPASEGSAFKDMKFEQVVAKIHPTAIVGAAAKRGSFSKPVIEALVQVLPPGNANPEPRRCPLSHCAYFLINNATVMRIPQGGGGEEILRGRKFRKKEEKRI